MLRRLRPGWIALILIAGCGGSTTDGSSADSRASGGADSGGADSGGAGGQAGGGAVSGSGGQTSTTCNGGTGDCVQGCGSDYYMPKECVDGSWRCPSGFVEPGSCPPGTCWGPPLPGESCGPEGWECDASVTGPDLCPELLCAVCDGVSEPETHGDCRCECDGGQVSCTRIDEPAPCEGSSFCECWARPDECQVQSDTCICHCDYECPGEAPCDCGCGGGEYLGCTARP